MALKRMLAMRAYMRAKPVDAVSVEQLAEPSGCPAATSRRCIAMAIANYEDRFVIPTAHRETGEDAFRCVDRAASRSATAVPARPASTCSARRRHEDTDGGMCDGPPCAPSVHSCPIRPRYLQAASDEIAASSPKSTWCPHSSGCDRCAFLRNGDDVISMNCKNTTSISSTAAASLSLHLFEHVHGESRDRGRQWRT